MQKSSDDLPDAEVYHVAIDRALAALHTARGGKVVSYAAGLARVALQTDGTELPDVPVGQLDWGNYVLTAEPQAGAECLVLFFESDHTGFLTKGSVAASTNARRHALGYPLAIPMALSAPRHSAAHAPGANLRVGHATATQGQIEFSPSAVLLGGAGASDPIVRKSDLDALADAMSQAITGIANAIQPLVAMAGPAPIGVPAAAAINAAQAVFDGSAAAITGSLSSKTV